MQIVQAVPFFAPATRFGGPVTQLPRVCEALAARGHRVEVVTTELGVDEGIPRETWLERDGYRVWYTKVRPPGRRAPYYTPRVTPALRETLVFADLLHLHVSFTHLNVVATVAARQHGVPYVYSPRGCLDPVRLRQKGLAKKLFLKAFERRIIREAAAIHVLNDEERAHALEQGAREQQLCVIPNASPLDPETPLPDGGIFRDTIGVDVAAPLVLFLGRLHSIKGLDLLVEAFGVARQRHPDARLVVAGPDEGERRAVERLAQTLGVADAVHLPGPLDGELRLAALRAADVVALLSRAEGMPNSVLEACATGTAVLVSDRCNLPEVDRYGAGRVVPADAEAAGAALTELLDDLPRLTAMGRRGRNLVRERFELSTVVDRFDELYQRILSGANRARVPRAEAA